MKSINCLRLSALLIKEGLFVYACHLYHLNNCSLTIFSMDYCFKRLAIEIRKLSDSSNNEDDNISNELNSII
jgi:hypothetical protein